VGFKVEVVVVEGEIEGENEGFRDVVLLDVTTNSVVQMGSRSRR